MPRLEIIRKIIQRLSADTEITTKEAFHKLKNDVYKDYKIPGWISDIDLLAEYKNMVSSEEVSDDARVFKLLRKRAVRSLSWVSVVSVLTKPWWCPWKCVYCPWFDDLPKSYIPNEPAVMRASMNAFDPEKQVYNRLRSLDITWHSVTKCDVRIIWWTWSSYDPGYQEDFIKMIYDAHSNYEDLSKNIIATDSSSERFASFEVKAWYVSEKSKDLEEAKTRNETAASRVIWIAIETRPDMLNPEEIIRLRRYWITRVEIWYQTTIDFINDLNLRWHGNKESIEATRILKDAWFKVVAHIMPNLLGSNKELDLESLRNVFLSEDFRPDELKIYPMMVTKNSELEKIWRSWDFSPYSDNELIELMIEMQKEIPEYVRLNRMYRDIPSTEILAWSHLANLRQIVDSEMSKRWIRRHDISAREIRNKNSSSESAVLEVFEYDASKWKEYYLQFVDPKERTLFAHLRLRIPSQYFTWEKHFINELEWSALIREVHTYWDQLRIWVKWKEPWQHIWFGKRLMAKAEDIIKEKYPNISNIAVISWVWVRQYYKSLWYELSWEYMVKEI